MGSHRKREGIHLNVFEDSSSVEWVWLTTPNEKQQCNRN
jgi:hypothetical protein